MMASLSNECIWLLSVSPVVVKRLKRPDNCDQFLKSHGPVRQWRGSLYPDVIFKNVLSALFNRLTPIIMGAHTITGPVLYIISSHQLWIYVGEKACIDQDIQ